MKDLENQVLKRLKNPREKKTRYTFTLSPSTKEALARWCGENRVKESTALEEIIKTVVPEKYFD